MFFKLNDNRGYDNSAPFVPLCSFTVYCGVYHLLYILWPSFPLSYLSITILVHRNSCTSELKLIASHGWSIFKYHYA